MYVDKILDRTIKHLNDNKLKVRSQKDLKRHLVFDNNDTTYEGSHLMVKSNEITYVDIDETVKTVPVKEYCDIHKISIPRQYAEEYSKKAKYYGDPEADDVPKFSNKIIFT